MADDSLDAFLKAKPGRKRSRVAGLKLADILTMPPEQQSLVNWLMRHYEATPETIATNLEQDVSQVCAHLQMLQNKGYLKTLEKHGSNYYRIKLAPKSGRQMPKDVWQVLDSSNQQANVFISYSRRNKEFVQELHSALEATGREVWVDWENIPVAVDWWQEIQLGIELADTFVFVLSPDSVASQVCGQEIEEALKHNKRLVPIVFHDVAPDQVHPELARLNWIFLRPEDDFKAGFKGLLEALDQDLDYVRTHTRLLVRALEWDRHERDTSYLLRGSDLERANRYLSRGKEQEPRPTALHHQYVLASAEAESTARDEELTQQRQALAEQKHWLQLVTAISVLAGALGLTSLGLSLEARRAQTLAEQSQLKALTQSAEALFLSDQRFESLIIATQAGKLFQTLQPEQQTPALKAQVMGSLQQTLFWVQERNRLEGHTGTVWQVAFSPDEQKLASVSADGTIRLWDLAGNDLGVLDREGGPLLDLDFAPDGQQLAAVDADGQLYLWDSAGELVTEWQAHAQLTRAVKFSPNGQFIATASEDATVKLWDREGEFVRTLTADLRGFESLIWTPDNHLIAGGDNGHIYIWDISGERLQTFTEHRAEVTALDISPDGKTLVSVGRDRQVKLYDLETNIVKNTFEAHAGAIYNTQFTPDGQEIITVGDDKLIHIWQLDGTLSSTLVGHTGLISALAISPTGDMIATSGGDRAVRLWDLEQDNLHILQAHRGPVNTVAIAPASDAVASGGVDGTINLWNMEGMQLRSLTEHRDSVNGLAFSPDGTYLASASSDNTVRVWQDWATASPTSVLLEGHDDTVNGLAFHPDGQRLATASNDNSLRLWNIDGTAITTVEDAHPDGLLSLAFSPDGKYLASTGWDFRIRLWEVDALETKDPIVLEGHRGWVLDAQFSADGELLATASYDNTVRLWRVSDGQLLQIFEGHQDGVLSVAFSPTEPLLMTASNDNTLRVWRLDGTLVTTLSGHEQGVRDVAIDANAEYAVSASSDSTVLIWERTGMNNIEQLLHSSCRWLGDYLASNKNVDAETQELCQVHDEEGSAEHNQSEAASPDTP
ncbi:MAG: TIR domain-containing protein [Cyanobacteria bacterium P01_H01_bin.58]